MSEWLSAFPEGRAQRWIKREWNKGEYKWGGSLKGEKKLWQKSTRDNALFLSTAVRLNSEKLQPVYEWFKNTLFLSGIFGWSPDFSASFCEKGGKKGKILNFLNEAGLGN